MKPGVFATTVILSLFLIRSCGIWYGFDRLPYLSNGEEAAQNDQAVSLSRGTGLIGRSYSGIFSPEGFRGHHMPIYLVTQAAVYYMFGFSAATLRGTSIAAHLGVCAIVVVFLARLLKRGVITEAAFLLCGLVTLLEPTALLEVRMGRNDSLTALFGIAGLFTLLASRSSAASLQRMMIAAILIGLAISTHPEGVVFWLPLLIAVFTFDTPRSAPARISILASPFLLAAAIWGVVYGAHSIEAFRQMKFWAATSAEMPITLRSMASTLLHAAPAEFVRLGGILFMVLILGLTASVCALFFGINHESDDRSGRKRLLWVFGVSAALQLIALFAYFGTQPSRLTAIFPMAVIALSLGVSSVPARLRRLAVGAVAILAVFEIASAGAVMNKIHAEYQQRDPARFTSLLREIPALASVAADRELWYAFQQAGRPFRIINFGVAIDKSYWLAAPQRLSAFDFVVIRESDWSELHLPLQRPSRRVVIANESFLILTR